MDTGKIRQYPKCGTKYKLHKFHSMTRDNDSVCCETCYTDLFSWNGSSVYTLEPIPENNLEIREVIKTGYSDLFTLCDETEGHYALTIKGIMNNLKHSDDKNCRCYIALHNGERVGFVYGHIIDDQTLYTQFMYVKKENRKCGIGKRLINKLE